MSKIAVFDKSGKEIEKIEIDELFDAGQLNTQVVHDVVVGYLANQRTGNASTKSRGQVRASTKKPWRQKGTGRARIGTVTSPIWRGGGVAFGPKPRDFRQNITSKMKKAALKNVFSDKFANGDVVVIDKITCDEPKTKPMVSLIEKLNLSQSKILIITEAYNNNLLKSVGNIPNVNILTAKDCNTYACINNDKILIEKEAVQIVKSRLI